MSAAHKRERDVIDVNCQWGVWVGSRRSVSYRIGTVRAPDRLLALKAARAQNPGKRISYVEQDFWEGIDACSR